MDGVRVIPGTTDHVDALVRLHLAAFPAADNVVSALGPGAVRAAYRWFVERPDAVVLVATGGDGVVGFTSLAEGSYEGRLMARVLPRALAAAVRRPSILIAPAVRERAARLLRRGGPELPEGARVAYTAVDPDARGRGVASALKQASIEWCRGRGIERMVTGLHRDNLASRRMNERAGFVEVPELRRGDMLIFVLPVGGSPGPGEPGGAEPPGPSRSPR